MHRRMPVVASIKSRSQFPGRCYIRIAIQRVTNVVGILLVHAGESEIRESLRRVAVELNRALGGSAHGEQEEDGADDEFHRS